MARAAVQRRLTWTPATVLDNQPETPRVHRLVVDAPGWRGHVPGQHVDVRLTADDGYTAQRSYSLASPPEEPHLNLLVERLDDGEVSPYLTDVAQAGDRFELRGPIGGWFVWSPAADRDAGPEGRRPVQLVGGGSGVAPFVAMLDQQRRVDGPAPVRLLLSVRTADDVPARAVVDPYATVTLTRQMPPGWRGESGRVDAALLTRCTFPPAERPRIYVCGPTAFAESAAAALVELGHDPAGIRIERFGASGGP
jgi:ferredoxin-NADP reductase